MGVLTLFHKVKTPIAQDNHYFNYATLHNRGENFMGENIEQAKTKIFADLQLLKQSMDASVREKVYQDMLNMDLDILHEILGARIQTETDVEILAYMAEILMERDSKSGINYMLPLLRSEEAPLRRHICGLLSNYGDNRSIEPLINRLEADVSADVRVIAAFALGKIRDESALPALRLAQAQDFETDFEGTSVSEQATDAILSILSKSQ